MNQKLQDIVDTVKERARKKRKDGRRCCANQLLHISKFLENQFRGLQVADEK